MRYNGDCRYHRTIISFFQVDYLVKGKTQSKDTYEEKANEQVLGLL